MITLSAANKEKNVSSLLNHHMRIYNPVKTSMMELFVKVVKDIKPLI